MRNKFLFLVAFLSAIMGMTGATPTQAASSAVSASDLRTLLTNLLEEHVYLAGTATGAALRGDNAAFTVAAATLDQNTVELGNAINAAYGPDAQTAFNNLWRARIVGLAAGGLLLAYALRANRRMGKVIGGSALALGMTLFFGSMAFASNPPKPLAVNPYAPDAQSLARGKSLYEQHCVVCHGPTGTGSRFLPADLRPTEFLTNTQAHSDDVLYDWLTNGMPGTAMVPWKARLTDAQRWSVLNYVEFLAEQDFAKAP
jgi:mono/diheme cytochrome c family protein